jgi:hypothetical protein
MIENSPLFELLKFLAAQIPEMSAMLLGMLIAVAKWREYPRPSLLAFLGFGLLLFVSIGGMFLVIWAPRAAADAIDHQFFVLIVWTVRSLLLAGAYLLLIFAIYTARRPVPVPPRAVTPPGQVREAIVPGP